MPQLDFSTFPSQVFWLAVVFAILYLLMARVGLPTIGKILADRRARIEGDLGRAQQMKSEAEAVMGAYQRTLADARAQAQATLKETMERFGAEAAQRQREAVERLAKEVGAAEHRIAAAKAAALGDLRGMAVDLARAATERLTGLAVEDTRARAVVDRVLKERG
ncbi:MAG TPA: F0F1 ATP synthase subunit B' [Stellaceae bacterium]|nr:F0F1 ATP synthase subunit B' [Stellaceae bacterium]